MSDLSRKLRQIINLNSGGFSSHEVEALLKAFLLLGEELEAVEASVTADYEAAIAAIELGDLADVDLEGASTGDQLTLDDDTWVPGAANP